MSIPRAAMSVATNTRTFPALKSASALVRAPCDLFPCIAAALMPEYSSNCLQSLFAPCFVRVNTSTCFHSPALMSCASNSRLRPLSTGYTTWLICLEVEFSRATSTSTGSLRSPDASAFISLEKVAEKSSVCLFFGMSAMSFLMS